MCYLQGEPSGGMCVRFSVDLEVMRCFTSTGDSRRGEFHGEHCKQRETRQTIREIVMYIYPGVIETNKYINK